VSVQSNRLKAEARHLQALADQVAAVFDRPHRLLQRLVAEGGFAGPFADETTGALARSRRVLTVIAGLLRDEAAGRLRRARQLEDRDSVAEDLTDLVTGRDLTPWA